MGLSLEKGAEWTEIPEHFRGSEPRNRAPLQTGSSSGAARGPALGVPGGEPCSYHRKHGMSRVRGRASEASEIRTLFDQAPKCQFFFL